MKGIPALFTGTTSTAQAWGQTGQEEIEKVIKKQESKGMKLLNVKKYLLKIIDDKIPIMLWGSPGIGKSAVVKQVADSSDRDIVDLRLSLLSPIDLRGLPSINTREKKAEWLVPDFLPKDRQNSGILFLDEINLAPIATQQAAYELIYDRRVGNYKLPAGWSIIAAGNRTSDRSYVNSIPMALLNRMIHLEVGADIISWLHWAEKNNIDKRVMKFLSFRPDLLILDMNGTDIKSYPTPRTWEYVSILIKNHRNLSSLKNVIYGTVGEEATNEFFAFLKIIENLPDISKILKGKAYSLPEDISVLDALIQAVVVQLEKKHIDNFIKFVTQLPVELSVLAIKRAISRGFKKDIKKYKNEYSFIQDVLEEYEEDTEG